jgi:putative Mg2+ transporter-C (MgtC) family protein
MIEPALGTRARDRHYRVGERMRKGGGRLEELWSFQWARDGGQASLQEASLRLVLAIVLSAAVGIDRELKQKPLGLRTNMLVALGAASFGLMALQLVHELASGPSSIQIDPSRVMEAIVGAIGFLGAAAIIQGRFELFGATTGASIWVVGGIGMACGFGFYGLALVVTVVGLFVLTVLGFITGGRSGAELRHPDEQE